MERTSEAGDFDWSANLASGGSCDGRAIRFTMSDAGSGGSALSLWEVSVSSGQLRHLLGNWSKTSTACCGNWTRDGKYYVFMGSMNGEANIWALREKTWFFERVGGEPVRLTTGPVMALFPVPSRDGRRIYINGYQARNEYFGYDLKRDVSFPNLAESPATLRSTPAMGNGSPTSPFRSNRFGDAPPRTGANACVSHRRPCR